MIEVAIKQQLGPFALDVTFNAPAGVTVLFGPSGSGKSSVINAIAGLSRPDTGRIVVDGVTLFDKGVFVPPHHRRVGYVFQDARLFPHMNVQRNLRYGGRANETQVIQLLNLSHLLDRHPANLSGGEKQRVAIGRALMRDPQVLLLDEPLAALDSGLKADILPYLEALRDTAEIPIIYVSHAIAEVTRLATSLVILNAGKSVQSGKAEDILSDPSSVALLGRFDAGAVLSAKVKSYDSADAITVVATGVGDVLLQGNVAEVGAKLRLRVPAQDIMLSLERPIGLSALNALPVTITQITKGDGPAIAVGLRAGDNALVAQISERSARELALTPGQNVFAIFKVTSATPDLRKDTL